MARYRLGNSFATLPFDKLDSVAGSYIHEDFEGAALLADLVDGTGVVYDAGGTRWWGTEIAGGAVSNITVPVSVADHYGIISLEVGSTSPADGDAAALQFGASGAAVQDTILLDDNGVYVAAVIRIPDVDAQKVEFGLTGQTPAAVNSSVADVISLVWDPEDVANVDDKLFLAQVNVATVDEEVVVDKVSYVEGDWVLLEIAATADDAIFRVTTEDNIQTVQIAPTPTVALRPFFAVENVGAAEEVLDIDLFHMRYLRRSDNIMDWLGA